MPTEQELAEQFGVGRTTIREALKYLSAVGLIYREKQATFIKEVSDKYMLESLDNLIKFRNISLSQVFEARTALELALVGMAADRCSPEELGEIISVHNNLNKDSSLDNIIESNIEFHLAIARASKNIILIELLVSMVELLRQTQKQIISQPGVVDGMIRDHAGIINAITDKDPNDAREAMKKHLDDAFQKHVLFKP